MEAVQGEGAGSDPPRTLEAALEHHLALHLGPQVTLRTLAAGLGYSASRTSDLVQRLTGKRFSTLRREMQLAHALTLLARGLPVKAAAGVTPAEMGTVA